MEIKNFKVTFVEFLEDFKPGKLVDCYIYVDVNNEYEIIMYETFGRSGDNYNEERDGNFQDYCKKEFYEWLDYGQIINEDSVAETIEELEEDDLLDNFMYDKLRNEN